MKLIEKNTYSTYVLFAILLVAAILRFIYIDQPFVDLISWRQCSNAMMAENFYRKNWNIFYPEVNWNGPGPSYNGRELQTVTYIAALCYNLVGQHEWVGRSVAVIFGLLGVFSLYQLVRRVWDNDRALMSAAVMAIMPGSIFIERSFMPDPAMVALVTTSFWMLVAYLQTDRLRYLFLASFIGCLGFLTKLPGLIIGLPMVYTIVIVFNRQKKPFQQRALNLSIAAILGLIPVIIYYLWARHLSVTYPPYHFAGSGNWLWDKGLTNWLSKWYFLPKLAHNFGVWIWTAPLIILVTLGLIFPPKKAELLQNNTAHNIIDHSIKLPWLFHWWFLAFIVYYLIGAEELVKNPWNFHILNPAAAALAGHTLATVFARCKLFAGRTLSLIVLGTFISIILWFGKEGLQWVYWPYALPNQQLGQALKKVSNPDDLVVTLESPLGTPVSIFYSQRRGWVFPAADTDYWSQLPDDDQMAINMFEGLRSKGADWFGIILEQKEDIFQKHPKLFQYIESSCLLKEKNSKWLIYKMVSPSDLTKLSGKKEFTNRVD